ncbi:trypsin-like serine peptidase [Staphylococcus agnetis]|uniref:trypsin-like serine peptidase n=2 Tax=Staphylococcus agnetis TaxID=985762 RepID=UPI001300A1F5|nr:trypsin-like peptidase domain-containing protein [Staphylococcus agnetis]
MGEYLKYIRIGEINMKINMIKKGFIILTLAAVTPITLQSYDTPLTKYTFANELSKEEHQEKWDKYNKQNPLYLPEGYFTKVSNTQESPYQSVGLITVKGVMNATASVVGKNKIITNFHVAREAKKDPSKIIFRPGTTTDDQRNLKTPYGEFQAESIDEAPFGEGVDLAIITLKPNADNKEVGEVVKPLEFGFGESLSSNQVLNLVGYPNNTVQNQMFKQRIEVHSTDQNLKYFGYTEEGNSGSPIFDDDNNLVGMHIGKSKIEGKGDILIGRLFDSKFVKILKDKLKS